MTAQPHQPARPYVPDLTIKSVRGALSPDMRRDFADDIEGAGLDTIRGVLEGWHTRSVLYAEGTADTAFANYRETGVPAAAVPWSAR